MKIINNPINWKNFLQEDIKSLQKSFDRIWEMLYWIRNLIAIYVFVIFLKFLVTVVLPLIWIASFLSNFVK